jgi:hypothetical protein
MVFRVPPVAPSAPLIHAQKENPGPGAELVPIMLYKLSPEPTVIRKVFTGLVNVEVVTDTPAKFVPLLSR